MTIRRGEIFNETGKITCKQENSTKDETREFSRGGFKPHISHDESTMKNIFSFGSLEFVSENVKMYARYFLFPQCEGSRERCRPLLLRIRLQHPSVLLPKSVPTKKRKLLLTGPLSLSVRLNVPCLLQSNRDRVIHAKPLTRYIPLLLISDRK